MSEYYSEPVLPYDTLYFSEWCRQNGVDSHEFGHELDFGAFLIAVLKSKELDAKAQLRQEVEDTLPLENALRINDPRLKPEFWGTEPKVYEAPKGFAFEMSVTWDEEFDPYSDFKLITPDENNRLTLAAEFLAIETTYENNTAQASIVLRERAKKHAVPILHDGNPDEGGSIRLPSRFDPDKDGAYVTFPRLQGWEVVEQKSKMLRGRYGNVEVKLVPFERVQETEVYVADFGRFNDFALDDFIYTDETISFPPGYLNVRQQGGGWALVHKPSIRLILPPMSQEDQYDVWDIVRFNHSTSDVRLGSRRFHHLRFNDRQDTLAFDIRQFNTKEKHNKAFMRALAIQDPGYMTSLKDILKIALSEVELEGEDIEKFG